MLERSGKFILLVSLKDNTLKILDFNLAKLLDQGEDHIKDYHAVGTVGYMAPEQTGIPGAVINERSDTRIFAFGCSRQSPLETLTK